MTPTRNQIIDKLVEVKATPFIEKKALISTWLDQIECPAEAKEKILDDLVSYPDYA